MRVLIIAGMHRSGTSLISGYLRECGLWIGDDLLPADVGNPHGYYEDEEFLKFHAGLLRRAGVHPFLIVDRDLPISILPQDKTTAREMIDRRADLPQWGWKEPRSTLFLSLWDEMIEDACFLFLFRHPLKVVDSLLRRGTDTVITQNPAAAITAWRVYNQQIFDFATSHPDRSIVCEIEQVVSAPTGLCARLHSRWGFELEAVPLETVFRDKSFRTQRERHLYRVRMRRPVEYLRSLYLFHKLRRISVDLDRA